MTWKFPSAAWYWLRSRTDCSSAGLLRSCVSVSNGLRSGTLLTSHSRSTMATRTAATTLPTLHSGLRVVSFMPTSSVPQWFTRGGHLLAD
jgi:hypothetical protein